MHSGRVRAVGRVSVTLLALATMVAALLTAVAPAAGAHATGALPATNWRSEVTAMIPRNDVLRARTTDLGNHLELRVAVGHDVIVYGYAGEPYLRFDAAGGVDENERSPATFLNRTSTLPGTATPSSYDAKAAPVWKRLTSGSVWRWHDHRVHHMPGDAGGHGWVVPLLVDGEPGTIAGRITYDGAAIPVLPIVAGAVALALGVLVDRARRATLIFSALAVASFLLLVAIARFGTGGALHDIGGVSYTAIATAGAASAAAWAATRKDSWAPTALLGGVVVLVAGGFTFASWIVRSQLPAALPGSLVRVLVAVLIGGGLGCVVSGARQLRPQPVAA